MADLEPCAAEMMAPVSAYGPRMRFQALLVQLMIGRGPDRFKPGAELATDRLVINAVGGSRVYRITGYDPVNDVYEAEWPD